MEGMGKRRIQKEKSLEFSQIYRGRTLIIDNYISGTVSHHAYSDMLWDKEAEEATEQVRKLHEDNK